MKIAFDNFPPDRSQVRQLITASGLEGQKDADSFFDEQTEQCHFVSAYDRSTLVGLGRFVRSRESGAGIDGRLDIIVLPDYRNRDIVETIFRLLSSRRSAGARKSAEQRPHHSI